MSRKSFVKVVLSAGVAAASAAIAWRVIKSEERCSSAYASSSTPLRSYTDEPSGGWEEGRCHCHVKQEADRTRGRGMQGLEAAVDRCRELVRRVMVEQGVPGAVVAVSRDGEVVWSEGIGLADVENDTPCTPGSGEHVHHSVWPAVDVTLIVYTRRPLTCVCSSFQ